MDGNGYSMQIHSHADYYQTKTYIHRDAHVCRLFKNAY